MSTLAIDTSAAAEPSRPAFRSRDAALWWKEAVETRDRTLMLAVIGVTCSLAPRFAVPDDWSGLVTALAFMIPAAAGVFFGIRVAAGETNAGTDRALLALPTPYWRTALPKLVTALLGVAVVSASLVMPAALWFAVSPDGAKLDLPLGPLPSSPSAWDWAAVTLLAGVASGASTFAWTAAFGRGAADEPRAALRVSQVAIGFGVVAWLAWFATELTLVRYFDIWFWDTDAGEWIIATWYGATFLVVPAILENKEGSHAVPTVWLVLVFIGTTVTLLAASVSAPSVRTPRARIETARPSRTVDVAIRPPGRTRVTSLITQSFYSLRWLACMCAVLIVLAFLPVILAGLGLTPHWPESDPWNNRLAYAADDVRRTWEELVPVVGVFLVLLLAAMLFGRELEGRHAWFWRSRPIPLPLWFGTRLLVAFALSAGALYLPWLFAGLMQGVYGSAQLAPTPMAMHGSVAAQWGWLFDREWFWLNAPFQAALLAAAVLAMALTRHAIHGAILGLGGLALLYALPEFGRLGEALPNWSPVHIAKAAKHGDPWATWLTAGYGWYAGLSLLVIAIGLIGGYHAIRRRV